MEDVSAIGVRVRTLSGESIALSGVRATDTIGDLKALVEAAAGIARAHQRLTFKHAPLAIDERSLVSHGVRDGVSHTFKTSPPAALRPDALAAVDALKAAVEAELAAFDTEFKESKKL